MIELREYQVKGVDELLDKATILLSGSRRQEKLVFKAPTGAGKTVMMGSWLKRMAQTMPSQYELPQRTFAYVWIAPNQLHQQSLLKLKEYFEETRELRCLEFADLADEALAENDLLFFNWQSISRDDAIVIRENEQGRNLENLVAATREKGITIDEQLRKSGDESTIGILLCKSKDNLVAEYALGDIHKPIGVSQYELTRALPDNLKSSLPSIEEIEAELSGPAAV